MLRILKEINESHGSKTNLSDSTVLCKTQNKKQQNSKN